MTAPVLLDASCVIAWLFNEPGADEIEPMLSTSYITAVNMAEVITKVERLSGQGQACADDLVEAGLTVMPVGWREIAMMSEIRRVEKALPAKAMISLGDAICLSVAAADEMEVWTADRSWVELNLPISMRLVK